MSVRTVKHELEAKLKSSSGGLFSKPSGKLERKTYDDFGERLKVSLRNLRVPDNSIAVVTADDVEIAQIQIHNGTGRIDHESRDPNAFPQLKAGQNIEVKVDATVVLVGELYVD